MLSGVKLTYESDADSIQVTGHVPTLLQMTGHGGTESKKNKKQESDQTVLATATRKRSAYQNDWFYL